MRGSDWTGPIAVLIALAAVPGFGQQPTETYAEKLVYDPKTGTFTTEAPPESGTADGDLELARRDLARERAKAARSRLKKWVKKYGEESPRFAEALFHRAEAELALGNYKKAYELFRDLIDAYPGTDLAERAAERNFVVAETFLAGMKQKFLGMRMLSATDDALDMLDTIAGDHPGTSLAEQAVRTRASYFFRTGDFDSAAIEYDRLYRDYPRRPYARVAALRSAQSSLASFPGVEFDASSLDEAEEKFRQFQRTYPRFAARQQVDLEVEQIRLSRAEKEYRVAEYYERVKKPDAAAFYYASIVQRFADTTWAARAQNRLDVMEYLAAEPAAPPANQPAGSQ